MSRFWTGVWREDADKSSIFVPSTISIVQAADMAYFLAESGGGRTLLDCTRGVPCDSLSVSPLANGRIAQSGIDYELSANCTELSVSTWRVVPDGTRLTDTDLYVRSTPGTGLAGSWRKVRSIEAPTTYRISVHQGRMTIAIPNGELHIEFSLGEANSPQGAYVSFGPGRGNRYKVLGPSYQDESQQGHNACCKVYDSSHGISRSLAVWNVVEPDYGRGKRGLCHG